MFKDKVIMALLSMGLIFFLIFSFEESSRFPFLMAVLIIFSLSLISFFIFMKDVTRTWYKRGFIVNFALIILLPLTEGIEFLFVSVIMLAILSFTLLALKTIE